MLSSKNLVACLVLVWLVASIMANASQADIGCPPTHDGKTLKDVELFDGPPSNKIEVVPENGRFVVPQRPQSLWQRFPASTLGCTYRGSKEMVTVVLPRYIQVCEFPHYPQVECR
jgi:hypothetical protein